MSTRWINNPFRRNPARTASGSGAAMSRSSRMRVLGVLALLVGALLNLAVAPGISAAAEASQPSATPAVGAPGTQFTFVATGFEGWKDADNQDAAELVIFWINTPDGQAIRPISESADDADSHYASAARADQSGTVEYTWRAPATATPGAYTLVAHGNKTGREQVIPFQLNGTLVPPSNVTPSAGAPGTQFTFVATGFEGYTHSDNQDAADLVIFWINTPDGQAVRAFRESADDPDSHYASAARADQSGTVEYTWRAPADATPGTYTLVAHGLKSGREQVVAFQIR